MIWRHTKNVGLVLLFVLFAGEVAGADRDAEVFQYAQTLQAHQPHLCVAIGVMDRESEQVKHFGCEASDYFQIGSITKVFTTTALSASSKVHSGTTLGDVYTEHISADAQQITLGQLASYTSGLPRLPDNIDLSSLDNPYASYTEADVIDYLSRYQSTGQEGTFAYSNLGLGLLGMVLAKTEGLPYEQVIAKFILHPLGLQQTWVDPQNKTENGVTLQGHGADQQPNTNWTFDALAGAGALWSNVGDMLNFARAQLAQNDSPLAKAISDTHQSQTDVSPAVAVGLGWMINTRDPKYLWHNGATAGFRSWMGFDTKRNRAAVVLANGMLSEVDLMGQALMGSDIHLPALATGSTLTPDQAKAYLGRYQLSPQAVLDVFMEGQELFVQVSGQPKFKLHSTGTDKFRTESVPTEIEFNRRHSIVTSLTLHQGGNTITAQRIGEVPIRAKLNLPIEKVERLVGTYRLRRGFELTVTRNDQALWVQATGQQNFPVFAESDTRFYYEVVAAELEFDLEDGTVEGVWLHQNGKHYAKKVR
ncbi:MAG: serine hydrolase [Pseudomonadota bacterium]